MRDEDLCLTCRFADWDGGEFGGCTHAILEECSDCIDCDSDNKGYEETEDGKVIKCCMYEEDRTLDNDNPENHGDGLR